MAKEIKTGSVELPDDEFSDEHASLRISMMLPMTLYKQLKAISLNDEHEGKYQLLIKDVLTAFVEQDRSRSQRLNELSEQIMDRQADVFKKLAR